MTKAWGPERSAENVEKKKRLWNLSLQASGETAHFILDKLQQKRAISYTGAGQIKWLSIISKESLGSIRNSPSAVITPITLPIADSIVMCLVQSGVGLLQGPDGFCLLWMCICRESFFCTQRFRALSFLLSVQIHTQLREIIFEMETGAGWTDWTQRPLSLENAQNLNTKSTAGCGSS